ncbi:MAG: DUF3343 domain-containing protein [Clostridia bacterium]|nr:DUF3343 domain-containing protein [Clostridia bacterium]
MTEILAVFRSRSQAADCYAKFKANNIAAKLINTPKECNIGCGLSVNFSTNAFNTAKFIIAKTGYSAFYGFFKMQIKYGRLILFKL